MSNIKFEELCNILESVVFEINSQFHIEAANPYALSLLKKKKNEVVGFSIIEILSEYEIDITLAMASAETNTVSTLSSLLILPNKLKIYIDWVLKKIVDEQKQVIYLLVGKNKTVEQGMLQREKDLQLSFNTILHHLPGFIYWKNNESRYLGCNENFAKVAGLNRLEDIIGKTDFDLAWKNTQAELFR